MLLWRTFELHSRREDVTDVKFAIEVEEKLVARILMCLSDKFPFLDPSYHLNNHFETKKIKSEFYLKSSLYISCNQIYVICFDFWIISELHGIIFVRGTKK